MKCQNCGFESADTICSICGAEIIETKEELQENQVLSYNDDSNDESKTESVEIKKPKKKVKKILLSVLIIILSAVVVSASSIAVFYYCTNDSRTSFSKINQAVNCGDYSVKIKEVKTPEFTLEYYPLIVYDLVFEFHNNTSQTLKLERPEIAGLITVDGADSGYMNCDYYTHYYVNGEKSSSISFEIPAWSSIEIIERVYYEDFSEDYLSVVSSVAVVDDEEVTVDNNSAEDDENGGDDSGEDEVIIDKSKIKYKKESLQKYKDNSPESFYLILADRKFVSDEEKQYARFFVEPDKEAIVIPEGDNIE